MQLVCMFFFIFVYYFFKKYVNHDLDFYAKVFGYFLKFFIWKHSAVSLTHFSPVLHFV